MKKNLLVLIIAVFILSACAPVTNKPGTDEPTAKPATATPQVSEPTSIPSPADSNLVRGNAFLNSTELLSLESYPLQFTLALKGDLPTPCHQLRIDVSTPDSENKINVDVYSVTQPDMICAQVIQPFEENFPLGSFPAGHYTLWINGKQVAEFDA